MKVGEVDDATVGEVDDAKGVDLDELRYSEVSALLADGRTTGSRFRSEPKNSTASSEGACKPFRALKSGSSLPLRMILWTSRFSKHPSP